MTELGMRLKEERENKGLSLDELQDITKIQKRYLVGIEEGNYTMMPGKFYVRAFIKQYAEAVGLDPDEIFDQYKNEIPTIYNEDLPEQLSRVHSRKNLSPGASKVLDLLPKLLIGIVILGVIVLVWYLIVKSADDDAKSPVNEGNNPVNIEETKKVEETEPKDNANSDEPAQDEKEEAAEEPEKPEQELAVAEKNGIQTVYELKNAEAFELKVASTGASWVGISNGSGKSLFQGTLEKGKTESQTFDLTNESEATIIVGFAPDTEIYVNGEKLEFENPPADSTRQDITIRYTKSE
ncbi:RodZ domain-containing protein [Mesobacillus foraminis]|uniref:helix-turn-helix domain-containing protein n=1 Tax=Mesobacillus foraminis TaxID=279826 RepID=UPI0039A2A320